MIKKIHPLQIELLKLETDHLNVLASAPCSEVFQCLSGNEPVSIREISEEVNRSTASVGEHIAKLVEVGLALAVGTRKRRAREETLYASRAFNMLFDPVGQSESATTACIKKFRCDLRQTDHMSAAAFQSISAAPELYDFVTIKSAVAYLDQPSALKMKAAIDEITKLFSELSETDPEVRKNGDYARVKLTSAMLPTTRESKSRANR